MTSMELKAKATDIAGMGSMELEEFKQNVSLSNIDAKSREYLYMAIDERELQLRQIDYCQTNRYVENGEIKGDEV